MITLDSPDKSLEIVLSEAATTTQPDFVVAYSDVGNVNQEMRAQGSVDGVTNDTTPVTLLAAPAEGVTRIVRYVSIYNADDDDREFSVSLNNNGTSRLILTDTLRSAQTKQYAQREWVAPDGGTVLTPAEIPIISPDTSTTHTATNADNGGLLIFNNAANCTLTLPNQASEELELGFYIMAKNEGGGQLIIELEGSDTLDGIRVLEHPTEVATFILEAASTSSNWGTIGNDWHPASVVSASLTAPPGTTPDVGAVFIPAATATGSWSGEENNFAIHIGSDVYQFVEPHTGWSVYDENLDLWIYFNGSTWSITSRQSLMADTDWYVNATTGNDDYNGLSPTDDGDGVGPFATIQAAIDTVAALDLSIYDATINVADGTYTDAIVLKTLVGAGTCFIVGNTGTPANVLIDSAESQAIYGSFFSGIYDISGLKIQTSGNYLVWAEGPAAVVRLGKNDYGGAGAAHVVTLGMAYGVMYEGYTISDGSARHLFIVDNSVVQFPNVDPQTITLTGTPDFSDAFAVVMRSGFLYALAVDFPFSGSATGPRFRIDGGNIFESTENLDYFPGDEPGTINNGAYGSITATSETGITASTTQTQAGATPLTATINVIGTTANNNDSVRMPACVQGKDLYIRNDGANNLQVFPASGDSISEEAVNDPDPDPVTKTGGSRHYKGVDDTNWMRMVE